MFLRKKDSHIPSDYWNGLVQHSYLCHHQPMLIPNHQWIHSWDFRIAHTYIQPWGQKKQYQTHHRQYSIGRVRTPSRKKGETKCKDEWISFTRGRLTVYKKGLTFTTSYNCWKASTWDENCLTGHLKGGMFVSGESSILSVEQKQLGARFIVAQTRSTWDRMLMSRSRNKKKNSPEPHGLRPKYSSPAMSFRVATPSPFGCECMDRSNFSSE